jgi:DNA-binding MarR family transcriptional regulator/DNA-binding CsgD family transcriptional regulator
MSDHAGDPQADSFGYWVFRLNRAMHAAFVVRLAALGVTAAEWTVLRQTGRGGVTPVALADHMGIDRAAVTRVVDRLAEKRLIRRTPHATDRRSTVLELTDRGAALVPELVAASRATNESFLGLVSRAEADALLGLLRKLGENLPRQVFPVRAGAGRAAAHPAVPALTAREARVFDGMAVGRSNKEIASALGVGAETVKSHVRNLFRKLAASDRVTAVTAAIRLGLVDAD